MTLRFAEIKYDPTCEKPIECWRKNNTVGWTFEALGTDPRKAWDRIPLQDLNKAFDELWLKIDHFNLTSSELEGAIMIEDYLFYREQEENC